MKARLLATVMVAAFAWSGAFAQQTDKQGPQTDPKETKTAPGVDEKAARSEDSAKHESDASKSEQQTPAEGAAGQSSEDNTPRQGDRIPEHQN